MEITQSKYLLITMPKENDQDSGNVAPNTSPFLVSFALLNVTYSLTFRKIYHILYCKLQ
jgi:hypothetical protein